MTKGQMFALSTPLIVAGMAWVVAIFMRRPWTTKTHNKRASSKSFRPSPNTALTSQTIVREPATDEITDVASLRRARDMLHEAQAALEQALPR